MVRKTVCIASIWLLLANALMFAGEVPIPQGRWEKVHRESPGTGLVVTLHGGERIECFLKSLSEQTITVITTETKEREIPKVAVQQIVTAEKRSGPLWNGAIIGAAVPTVILAIAAAKTPKDSRGGLGAAFVLCGGIGALIGVAIDAVSRGQITLYKAKAPKAD